MTRPYRLSIEQFVSHFRGQLALIDQVPSEQFRQTLYCLLIDPLAIAAYPKSGSRENSVRLIREHSEWPDADRVSRLQLRLALKDEGLSASPLAREVARRLKHQPITDHTPLSTSPLFNEMEPHAKSKEELRVLRLCTYAHLFYTYRSTLVHEFRLPGYQSDWGRGSHEPYYGKSAFDEYQLVFPVAFVSRVASTCLANLERHLLACRTAPHSKFNFGSLWRWK